MSSFTAPWNTTKSIVLGSSGSGGGGSGTLTFQDPSHDYIIEQISVYCPGGQGGYCQIFIDNAFICGSLSGALDSADGTPSLQFRAGSKLTVVWTNVDAGHNQTAYATFIGQVVVPG